MNTLKQLRQQIIQARQILTTTQCADAANLIAKQFFALKVFKESQNIVCYLSFKNEVHTKSIIEKIWAEGKNCYLPIITHDKNLQYMLYTPETFLTKNKYHFFEPEMSKENSILAYQLDLVITPVVVFDEQCTRIGWGHGHYDRSFSFLKNLSRPEKPFLVGMAYELQKHTNLKRETWDVPLDAVITESTVYYPMEEK